MLIDRWPNFLQDILEFRKIAEAEQPEFDGAIQAVESLHHEFSIFTVTEIGAARWERILGIQRAPGDTLAQRRSKIQTRYLSQLPYTYRNLLRYLAQISGDFTVNLDYANYTLYLDILLTGYEQKEALFAVLADMLPVNILLKLKSLIPMTTDNAPITPAVGVFTQVRHRSEPIQRGES